MTELRCFNSAFVTRCLKLAVVHDLAECIVGDITPSDPMGREEKHRREKVHMGILCMCVINHTYTSGISIRILTGCS